MDAAAEIGRNPISKHQVEHVILQTKFIGHVLQIGRADNYWPCAGGLSAMNAIDTQLRDLINSGLIRWRMAI